MKARELTADEVTFTLSIEPEDNPVAGSFELANGDADREIEEHILAELNRGNLWAWCQVRVVAHWRGYQGADYLGGCSYLNEAEFRADPYFTDMCREALAALNREIAQHVQALRGLV